MSATTYMRNTFTSTALLAKAIRATSLTTEKTRGERVEAPQRDFVEKDHWDQALDGVYDASKETEEVIMGRKRKGCWVHRGRKGVLDFIRI